MALKATIYQLSLELVDLDRHYYETHQLTLACHPSETVERLMVRILVFALNANQMLEFGKGVSQEDEPALWQKDLTGAIELWIELGHPDERIIVRAAGKSKKVRVYTYDRSPELWLNPLKARFSSLKNLEIYNISPASVDQLATLVDRRMNLQCIIQDNDITFRNADGGEVIVEIGLVE